MRNPLRMDLKPLFALGIAAMLGAATVSVHQIAFLIGIGILGLGLIRTIHYRNRHGEAHLYAALIVGAEVYFRMSFAGLPWEFGKISVILLLTLGMIVERSRRPMPLLFIFYGIFLIPAIFVTEWQSFHQFKKEIMFDFSGQISLLVAMFYFYRRNMSMEELVKVARYALIGIIFMSAMLLLKVPDYSAIHYGGNSSFAASGGFGPNQVSVELGLGIFLLGLFLMLHRTLFVYRFVDIGLLVLFTLQGFFTLSRGGLITAFFALILSVFFVYLFYPRQAPGVLKLRLWKAGLFILVIAIAFIQANRIAQGAIERRYLNVDRYGEQIKADYSTKREDIVKADIKTFVDNWWTGAGLGESRKERDLVTGIAAPHVEFSRMLADHGILGLAALIILFLYPAVRYFGVGDVRNHFLLSAFVLLALLTMSHNAMRLAMPGFFYGMGFIMLRDKRVKMPAEEKR